MRHAHANNFRRARALCYGMINNFGFALTILFSSPIFHRHRAWPQHCSRCSLSSLSTAHKSLAHLSCCQDGEMYRKQRSEFQQKQKSMFGPRAFGTAVFKIVTRPKKLHGETRGPGFRKFRRGCLLENLENNRLTHFQILQNNRQERSSISQNHHYQKMVPFSFTLFLCALFVL